MTDLGPSAKELIAAGRAAFKPTDADRERVLQALLPRLGPIVPDTTTASGALGHGAMGQGVLGKVAFGVMGLGLVGAGFMLARPSEPAGTDPLPDVSTLAPTIVLNAPSTPSAPLTAEPVREQPEAPPVRSPRSDDRLAEEVAILSRAGAALRGGRPAEALRAVDEHQRRFPSGLLAQERSAARVQALCSLGRVEQGLGELKRLERTAPRSPHVARARKACGLDRADTRDRE